MFILSGLEEEQKRLTIENKRLRLQRSDSYFKKHTDELLSEMEVLQLENHHLKEMIREKDDILDKNESESNDNADKTAKQMNHTSESEPKLPAICINSTDESQIAYV